MYPKIKAFGKEWDVTKLYQYNTFRLTAENYTLSWMKLLLCFEWDHFRNLCAWIQNLTPYPITVQNSLVNLV